jgi:hypothetical protein
MARQRLLLSVLLLLGTAGVIALLSSLALYVSDGSARVIDLDPIARKVRSDVPLSAQPQSAAR